MSAAVGHCLLGVFLAGKFTKETITPFANEPVLSATRACRAKGSPAGVPHIWKAACVARRGVTQEVICSLPENILEISILIHRGCGILIFAFCRKLLQYSFHIGNPFYRANLPSSSIEPNSWVMNWPCVQG